MERHIDVEHLENSVEVALIFDYESGPVLRTFSERVDGPNFRELAKSFAVQVAKEEGGLTVTHTNSEGGKK